MHITGVASDPDNDPLIFSWESSGGQIVGSGSEVDLDTTQLEPSHYTVTGHVSDGRGGIAVCRAEITYIKGQLLSQEQDLLAQRCARAEQETEERKSVRDQIGDHDKQRIQ